MRFRVLDLASILLSILVIAAFSAVAYGGNGKGSDVIIEASGKQWIYPLDQNRVIPVAGPLGTTLVVIRDGKSFVQDSPCPDKLCVLAGSVSKPGQWIACLPNKVMVRIGGKSAERIDDVSF